MPILFHYTSENCLSGIFKDGFIRPGKVVVPPAEFRYDFAVCLTSDIDSAGHGLPDGRQISAELAAKLPYVRVQEKIFSVDQTEYRIVIDIPSEDSKLVRVLDFLETCDPMLIVSMELSGWHPTSLTPFSEANLDEYVDAEKGKRLRGKSLTWWYYCGFIPVDWFRLVERKNGSLYQPSLLEKIPKPFRT